MSDASSTYDDAECLKVYLCTYTSAEARLAILEAFYQFATRPLSAKLQHVMLGALVGITEQDDDSNIVTHAKLLYDLVLFNMNGPQPEKFVSDSIMPIRPFPDDVIRDMISKYDEQQAQYEKLAAERAEQRSAAKYRVGEVVGVKNKDGVWYLSRVLYVAEHCGLCAYFIEYMGMGDAFNEVITDAKRIEKYNPHKHIYNFIQDSEGLAKSARLQQMTRLSNVLK